MSIKKLTRLDPVEITEGLQIEGDIYDQLCRGEIDFGYFLWRSKKALVVPRTATRKGNFTLASAESESKGWPVVVRGTGGELTPQCDRFFNLSIFVRCQDVKVGITDSYGIICELLVGWLHTQEIKADCHSIDGAFCDGEFNVNIDGKKIAGTAQRWRKIKADSSGKEAKALLLHAVFLCDGELDEMWDVCNQFYTRCDVEPFIKSEKHISLATVLNSSGDDFVVKQVNNLKEFLDENIHKQCSKFIN